MGITGIGNNPYYFTATKSGKNAADEIAGKTADNQEEKFNFAQALSQYEKRAKDQIKNGDPSFQLGGKSYTEEEWKKLIHKVDKDLEAIQEAQAERAEELDAEADADADVQKTVEAK